MACSSLSARSQATPFICEACLGWSRPLQTAQPTASRLFNTASSANRTTSQSGLTSLRYAPKRAVLSLIPNLSFRHIVSRALYSTETFPKPASSGIAPLAHRRLVSLSGPDAAKFLQGLVTNNVDPNRHTPFYSAFLDARGRVLWDVFIWVYPALVKREGNWACHIEVDSGEADALMKHLKRHKLRSKIKISVVDDQDLGVWASWGQSAEQLQDESLVASLPDPRGPHFGVRCLYTGSGGLAQKGVIVDTLQYHIRRYLYGIPEGPKEIQPENALPMECNIDLSNGIDFKKGCYVGQELTIRTKHTGVVRKRVLPIVLYNGTLPPSTPDHKDSNTLPPFDQDWKLEVPESGADIKQLDENGQIKKGRAAGKFIASIGNVGLALCRLEVMTSMRISAEGGSWRPNLEFGIQNTESEELVKIQAVVPQWFKERERDMWDKNRTRV